MGGGGRGECVDELMRRRADSAIRGGKRCVTMRGSQECEGRVRLKYGRVEMGGGMLQCQRQGVMVTDRC